MPLNSSEGSVNIEPQYDGVVMLTPDVVYFNDAQPRPDGRKIYHIFENSFGEDYKDEDSNEKANEEYDVEKNGIFSKATKFNFSTMQKILAENGIFLEKWLQAHPTLQQKLVKPFNDFSGFNSQYATETANFHVHNSHQGDLSNLQYQNKLGVTKTIPSIQTLASMSRVSPKVLQSEHSSKEVKEVPLSQKTIAKKFPEVSKYIGPDVVIKKKKYAHINIQQKCTVDSSHNKSEFVSASSTGSDVNLSKFSNLQCSGSSKKQNESETTDSVEVLKPLLVQKSNESMEHADHKKLQEQCLSSSNGEIRGSSNKITHSDDIKESHPVSRTYIAGQAVCKSDQQNLNSERNQINSSLETTDRSYNLKDNVEIQRFKPPNNFTVLSSTASNKIKKASPLESNSKIYNSPANLKFLPPSNNGKTKSVKGKFINCEEMLSGGKEVTLSKWLQSIKKRESDSSSPKLISFKKNTNRKPIYIYPRQKRPNSVSSHQSALGTFSHSSKQSNGQREFNKNMKFVSFNNSNEVSISKYKGPTNFRDRNKFEGNKLNFKRPESVKERKGVYSHYIHSKEDTIHSSEMLKDANINLSKKSNAPESKGISCSGDNNVLKSTISENILKCKSSEITYSRTKGERKLYYTSVDENDSSDNNKAVLPGSTGYNNSRNDSYVAPECIGKTNRTESSNSTNNNAIQIIIPMKGNCNSEEREKSENFMNDRKCRMLIIKTGSSVNLNNIQSEQNSLNKINNDINLSKQENPKSVSQSISLGDVLENYNMFKNESIKLNECSQDQLSFGDDQKQLNIPKSEEGCSKKEVFPEVKEPRIPCQFNSFATDQKPQEQTYNSHGYKQGSFLKHFEFPSSFAHQNNNDSKVDFLPSGNEIKKSLDIPHVDGFTTSQISANKYNSVKATKGDDLNILFSNNLKVSISGNTSKDHSKTHSHNILNSFEFVGECKNNFSSELYKVCGGNFPRGTMKKPIISDNNYKCIKGYEGNDHQKCMLRTTQNQEKNRERENHLKYDDISSNHVDDPYEFKDDSSFGNKDAEPIKVCVKQSNTSYQPCELTPTKKIGNMVSQNSRNYAISKPPESLKQSRNGNAENYYNYKNIDSKETENLFATHSENYFAGENNKIYNHVNLTNKKGIDKNDVPFKNFNVNNDNIYNQVKNNEAHNSIVYEGSKIMKENVHTSKEEHSNNLTSDNNSTEDYVCKNNSLENLESNISFERKVVEDPKALDSYNNCYSANNNGLQRNNCMESKGRLEPQIRNGIHDNIDFSKQSEKVRNDGISATCKVNAKNIDLNLLDITKGSTLPTNNFNLEERIEKREKYSSFENDLSQKQNVGFNNMKNAETMVNRDVNKYPEYCGNKTVSDTNIGKYYTFLPSKDDENKNDGIRNFDVQNDGQLESSEMRETYITSENCVEGADSPHNLCKYESSFFSDLPASNAKKKADVMVNSDEQNNYHLDSSKMIEKSVSAVDSLVGTVTSPDFGTYENTVFCNLPAHNEKNKTDGTKIFNLKDRCHLDSIKLNEKYITSKNILAGETNAAQCKLDKYESSVFCDDTELQKNINSSNRLVNSNEKETSVAEVKFLVSEQGIVHEDNVLKDVEINSSTAPKSSTDSNDYRIPEAILNNNFYENVGNVVSEELIKQGESSDNGGELMQSDIQLKIMKEPIDSKISDCRYIFNIKLDEKNNQRLGNRIAVIEEEEKTSCSESFSKISQFFYKQVSDQNKDVDYQNQFSKDNNDSELAEVPKENNYNASENLKKNYCFDVTENLEESCQIPSKNKVEEVKSYDADEFVTNDEENGNGSLVEYNETNEHKICHENENQPNYYNQIKNCKSEDVSSYNLNKNLFSKILTPTKISENSFITMTENKNSFYKDIENKIEFFDVEGSSPLCSAHNETLLSEPSQDFDYKDKIQSPNNESSNNLTVLQSSKTVSDSEISEICTSALESINILDAKRDFQNECHEEILFGKCEKEFTEKVIETENIAVDNNFKSNVQIKVNSSSINENSIYNEFSELCLPNGNYTEEIRLHNESSDKEIKEENGDELTIAEMFAGKEDTSLHYIIENASKSYAKTEGIKLSESQSQINMPVSEQIIEEPKLKEEIGKSESKDLEEVLNEVANSLINFCYANAYQDYSEQEKVKEEMKKEITIKEENIKMESVLTSIKEDPLNVSSEAVYDIKKEPEFAERPKSPSEEVKREPEEKPMKRKLRGEVQNLENNWRFCSKTKFFICNECNFSTDFKIGIKEHSMLHLNEVIPNNSNILVKGRVSKHSIKDVEGEDVGSSKLPKFKSKNRTQSPRTNTEQMKVLVDDNAEKGDPKIKRNSSPNGTSNKSGKIRERKKLSRLLNTIEKQKDCSSIEGNNISKKFDDTQEDNHSKHLNSPLIGKNLKTNKDLFKCSCCDYSATSINGLKKHRASHCTYSRISDQNNFCCNKCPYTGRTLTLLKRHQMTHLEKKRFQCSKCNYSTNFNSYLIEHNIIHTSMRPFKCSYCDFASKLKSNIKKHERTHLNGLKKRKRKSLIICPYCSFSVSLKVSMEKHLFCHFNNGELNSCPKCSYNTLEFNEWATHLISHDQDIGKGTVVNLQPKPLKRRFCCKECNFSVRTKRLWQLHIKEKHAKDSEAFSAESVKKNVESNCLEFKDSRLKKKKQLSKDGRRKILNVALPGESQICNKNIDEVADYESGLLKSNTKHNAKLAKEHIKLNSLVKSDADVSLTWRTKKYKCLNCEFSTNSNRSWDKHQIVHIEKKLDCNYCKNCNSAEVHDLGGHLKCNSCNAIDTTLNLNEKSLNNQVNVNKNTKKKKRKIKKTLPKSKLKPSKKSNLQKKSSEKNIHHKFTSDPDSLVRGPVCEEVLTTIQDKLPEPLSELGNAQGNLSMLPTEDNSEKSCDYEPEYQTATEVRKDLLSKSYTCSKCPYSSDLKRNLKSHILKHNKSLGNARKCNQKGKTISPANTQDSFQFESDKKGNINSGIRHAKQIHVSEDLENEGEVQENQITKRRVLRSNKEKYLFSPDGDYLKKQIKNHVRSNLHSTVINSNSDSEGLLNCPTHVTEDRSCSKCMKISKNKSNLGMIKEMVNESDSRKGTEFESFNFKVNQLSKTSGCLYEENPDSINTLKFVSINNISKSDSLGCDNSASAISEACHFFNELEENISGKNLINFVSNGETAMKTESLRTRNDNSDIKISEDEGSTAECISVCKSKVETYNEDSEMNVNNRSNKNTAMHEEENYDLSNTHIKNKTFVAENDNIDSNLEFNGQDSNYAWASDLKMTESLKGKCKIRSDAPSKYINQSQPEEMGTQEFALELSSEALDVKVESLKFPSEKSLKMNQNWRSAPATSTKSEYDHKLSHPALTTQNTQSKTDSKIRDLYVNLSCIDKENKTNIRNKCLLQVDSLQVDSNDYAKLMSRKKEKHLKAKPHCKRNISSSIPTEQKKKHKAQEKNKNKKENVLNAEKKQKKSKLSPANSKGRRRKEESISCLASIKDRVSDAKRTGKTKPKKKEYNCLQCDYSSTVQHLFEKHKRSHLKEKHEKLMSSSSTSLMKNLKRRQGVNHKYNLYQCENCSFSCNYKKTFTRHQVTHGKS